MKLEEILDDHGVEIAPEQHRHTRPGWLNFDCPFCGPGSKKYHMGWNQSRGYFVCWVCGWHSAREVLAELIGEDNVRKVKLDFDLPPVKEKRRKSSGKLVQPDFVLPLSDHRCRPHRKYLRKRGFDPDEIEQVWGVQGIGIAPDLPWRLYIPVIVDGEIVSWTSRAIVDDAIPYISAPPEKERKPHKSVLYGQDFCFGACIVHEGPLDVWATGPGAVATFGVTTTPNQVARLSEFSTVVVCFDSEPDAQRRAENLCRDLAESRCTVLNFELETGKDAATADPAELQELRSLIGVHD